MNKLSLLLVLILFTASCAIDDEDGISGRYNGTQRFGIGQVNSAYSLVISRQGNIIVGSVTPPFSTELVPFQAGTISSNTVRFDRREGNITFRYEGTIQAGRIQGDFEPLGCLIPSSGEPCLTDSNGSFEADRQ